MNTKKNDRLPPFCPHCEREGEVWRAVSREVEQTLKGETLSVTAEVSECAHCGFRLLTTAQLGALAGLTADAYRRRHGLLTSTQIRSRRQAMHLSQWEFAHWLGVGPASIKRWEHNLVQDRANDLLIRQRTTHTECFLHEEYVVEVVATPQMDNLVTCCTRSVTDWMMRPWVKPQGHRPSTGTGSRKAPPPTPSDCQEPLLYALAVTA